jgi:outer membrane protein assembly factor BamD
MFKKTTFITLIVGLLVFSFGCSKYQKALKSGNNDLKYETGVDLYEKGDYTKALQFFDILRAIYRGTEKGEQLTYYTAQCYFNTNDYEIASYYYKQYMQMYPRGDKAEECAFQSAYCNYLASPRYSLDQTNTYTALTELQMFIDMYPKSPKVAEANKLMDELRAKLELKDFNTAKLYYRMERYQAAITSFENLLDEYPDTDFKEQVLYLTVKAYYEYAEKSIYSKRKERFEKTVEAYNSLKYLYPESKYLKELKDIDEQARQKLK